MKKLLILLMAFGLFAASCGDDSDTETQEPADEAPAEDDMPADGLSVDEINVAYFAEWPTPNQFGQADGSFAEAVGAAINWLPFGSGGEMSEAMLSGAVDISYSQGLTPFAGAINNGADLKLVGIAVSYAEADNCVAQGDLAITRDNAADVLNGKTVMTPFGNVTHYKMLSMMEFLGVDLDSLDILQAEGGATTAAAFESGGIDVGCAFGGSVVNMLDGGGELIMTGAEHESDIGIFTYDIVSIPTSFGTDHGDAVTAFLSATEDFNAAWAADMEGQNPTIALAAGMEDVANFLGGDLWFDFPTIADQLGADWLGGNVAAAMQGQVETLARLGDGSEAIGDFAGSVDTSYLEAIG
ncbi:MAG: taurine transport system substrate-binding protein [Candidatus Aldehydirespiratoraceae bacterium]